MERPKNIIKGLVVDYQYGQGEHTRRNQLGVVVAVADMEVGLSALVVGQSGDAEIFFIAASIIGLSIIVDHIWTGKENRSEMRPKI